MTGNYWPFEICKTLFSLRLPDTAGNPFSEIILPIGEEDGTYRSDRILEDGRIESRNLFHREDSTVLYHWPHALLGSAPVPQTTNILSHPLLPSTLLLLVCFPSLLLACGWLCLQERRPQFTPVDVIEIDVIPSDYTPSMSRLDTKLVYDDKGFYADIVSLVVKGKVYPEGHYGKNQQILIRVNEGVTRNNAVLLPAEQLLLRALFRKGGKITLTERRNRVLRKAFLRVQRFCLSRRESSFYQPDAFL